MPIIISSSCLNEEENSLLFDPKSFDPDKVIIVIDADRCIGCKACEIHCWNEHRTTRENEESSLHVIQFEKNFNNPVGMSVCYYPNMCAHCEDPECLANCPAGAISMDDNGAIMIYEEKCIGCLTCSIVCPNYYLTYSKKTGRTLKCDGCFSRLKKGFWPACATKCSMKAIYVGYPEEIARILKEKKVNGDRIYIINNSVKGLNVV